MEILTFITQEKKWWSLLQAQLCLLFCLLFQEPFHHKHRQDLPDGLAYPKHSVSHSYLPDAFSQDLKDSLVIVDILH